MPTATEPRTVPHGRATRSSSRARSIQPPESAGKLHTSSQRAKAPKTVGKGKGKARVKEDLSTVLELTDSEDDKVAPSVLAPRQSQSKYQPRVNAGRIRLRHVRGRKGEPSNRGGCAAHQG